MSRLRSRLDKVLKKGWCKCKFAFFEILVGSILIIYLHYVIASFVLLTDNSKTREMGGNKITSRPPPLFQIPKSSLNIQNTTPSLNALKVCKVKLAIILCEDDRYLSLKNKSIHDVPKVQRGTIAKDFSRQINQTLVLMKSVAILTKYDGASRFISPCVEFLLLADKPTHYEKIKNEIRSQWSVEFQQLVKISNVPVRYPPGSSWMRKLFRPCATLRLFLAEILPPSIESVIYVDTDVIFLQSAQELWTQFNRFDNDIKEGTVKKLAAMAPCLFHYGSSANSVPYYGTSGLNAGIMPMNLTRMRTSQWTNKIRMVTTMFQDKIILADQDILNIYFHFFPEELHLLSCNWNFRPFQCREGSHCTDPELSQGISALHGNALSFTPQGPEPLFLAAFKTFHRTKLDKNFKLKAFLGQLESSLVKAEEKAYLSTSHCKRYGGLDVLILNRFYGLLEQLKDKNPV